MTNPTTAFSVSAHARQLQAVRRAEQAARAVDRIIGGLWQELLASFKPSKLPMPVVYKRAHAILSEVLPATHAVMGRHLGALAEWSHVSAAEVTVESLPVEWLAAAVVGRIRDERYPHGIFHELGSSILGAAESRRNGISYSGRARQGNVQSLESGHFPAATPNVELPLYSVAEDRTQPTGGIIRFALDLLGRLTSSAVDFAKKLSKVDAKKLFASILFPAPTMQQVKATLGKVLAGQTWYQALHNGAAKAKFGPDKLADTIAREYSKGATQREIAKKVMPYVEGVRYRARRTARTFGMAIAQQGQNAMHEPLADLIIGWQVHATLDANTRPAHRARNLTIYYAEPGPGQAGYDQKPDPPQEADGSLAWNCRCWLSPVLRPPVI